MQTDSSSIWTWATDSISCDNHYIKHATELFKLYLKKINLSFTVST